MPSDELSPEETASLHLESYGNHPDDCELCRAGDPTYVLMMENDMGVILRHQAHLKLVQEGE